MAWFPSQKLNFDNQVTRSNLVLTRKHTHMAPSLLFPLPLPPPLQRRSGSDTNSTRLVQLSIPGFLSAFGSRSIPLHGSSSMEMCGDGSYISEGRRLELHSTPGGLMVTFWCGAVHGGLTLASGEVWRQSLIFMSIR